MYDIPWFNNFITNVFFLALPLDYEIRNLKIKFLNLQSMTIFIYILTHVVSRIQHTSSPACFSQSAYVKLS